MQQAPRCIRAEGTEPFPPAPRTKGYSWARQCRPMAGAESSSIMDAAAKAVHAAEEEEDEEGAAAAVGEDGLP